MKAFWQAVYDGIFLYLLAWSLIILSPLWFPIWFAKKLGDWVNENT